MIRKLIFIIVIMSVVSLAFAGGIALSGLGTRAKAMGGAMRGLADDASAMYWNPAGLSFMEESVLNLGIHYVDFNGEWEKDGNVIENEDVLNLIPSVVYGHVCPDKPWNFGIGVYVPFGLSAQWDIYQMPNTMWVDTDGDGIVDTEAPITWSDEIEEFDKYGSLMVLDFHPTVSYKLSDQLSMGLGISMDYASMKINMVEEHPLYGKWLPTYVQLQGSGIGFGYNYGFLFKPNSQLSLGFSARTPIEVKLAGDAEIDTYLNNIIAGGQGFSTHTVIHSNPDVEATLVLPADWGWGIAYRVMKNWLLSADFTYTWWESLDVIELDFEEGFDDDEMVLNWKNTVRFGLGTEYLWDKWAFRAGYYYDESPLVDETMTVTFPDFNTKHALNFGRVYNTS